MTHRRMLKVEIQLAEDLPLLCRFMSAFFGANIDDVTAEKLEGETHLAVVMRDNFNCSGSIQFFESIGVIVKRERCSINGKEVERCLLPATSLQMIKDASLFKSHHRYVLMHSCFSRLLKSRDDCPRFSFSGNKLVVSALLSMVPVLQPLANHPKLKSCIQESAYDFTINFNVLAKLTYSELSQLFVELSDKEHPISWTDFPVTYFMNRMNQLLDDGSMWMYAYNQAKDAPEGLCLQINRGQTGADMMISFLKMRGIAFHEASGVVSLGRRTLMTLIPSLETSQFESEFRKFKTEQWGIVNRVRATGVLDCSYLDTRFIISCAAKPGQKLIDAFMCALFLETITPNTIEATLAMCVRAKVWKDFFDRFPSCITAKFNQGCLVVTSNNLPVITTLKALMGEKFISSSYGLIYPIGFNIMKDLPDNLFEAVKRETEMLVDRSKQVPSKVSATLHGQSADSTKSASQSAQAQPAKRK